MGNGLAWWPSTPSGRTPWRLWVRRCSPNWPPPDDDGTVAVIVPSLYAEGISQALTAAGVEHGQVGRNALESEVTVLVLADAKGLEFDTVIVVEPAALIRDAPQGLRSLYVALTRPTKRLVIVHGEPLPTALVSERLGI